MPGPGKMVEVARVREYRVACQAVRIHCHQADETSFVSGGAVFAQVGSEVTLRGQKRSRHAKGDGQEKNRSQSRGQKEWKKRTWWESQGRFDSQFLVGVGGRVREGEERS